MNTKSMRQEWTFSYAGPVLHDGAVKKRSFHEGRLAFWEAKQTEVMEKIKAEGIKIEGTLSDLISNSYRGPQVEIRPDLMNDIMECNSKVNEHRERIKAYDAWCQVLASGSGHFNLTMDDWLFFFGK